MEIGFVSVWFARGQAYVTRALIRAVEPAHRTHLLARRGVVGHVPGRPAYLETTGEWAHDDVLAVGERLEAANLGDWVRSRKLDWVVFNEEGQWELVEAARQAGARTATYVTIDWVRREDVSKFSRFDLVVAPSARCAQELLPYVGSERLLQLGWGVDLGCFVPADRSGEPLVFLHNAGWGGSGYRKNTPAVVRAWQRAALRDARLILHTQRSWSSYPLLTRMRAGGIEVVEGTIPHPGLYDRADVLVQPSKMEGLGLPLVEGLAAGLAIVTTDAPVMNEWVEDGVCGRLVPVRKFARRGGAYVVDRLALVDERSLARILAELAADSRATRQLGLAARQRAVARHDWKVLGQLFCRTLEERLAPAGAESRSER